MSTARAPIYTYIYICLCQAPTASLSACVSHILEYVLTTARPRAGATRRSGARGKRTARLAHATWASWCSDASVYIIFFIFFEKKCTSLPKLPTSRASWCSHASVWCLIFLFFHFSSFNFFEKKGKPDTLFLHVFLHPDTGVRFQDSVDAIKAVVYSCMSSVLILL